MSFKIRLLGIWEDEDEPCFVKKLVGDEEYGDELVFDSIEDSRSYLRGEKGYLDFDDTVFDIEIVEVKEEGEPR